MAMFEISTFFGKTHMLFACGPFFVDKQLHWVQNEQSTGHSASKREPLSCTVQIFKLKGFMWLSICCHIREWKEIAAGWCCILHFWVWKSKGYVMFKFRAACSQSRSSEDAPVHSFTKCQKENSSREREREKEKAVDQDAVLQYLNIVRLDMT